MALPALTIGQDVLYYPSYLDSPAMTDGRPGPVAAKVTKIDTTNSQVNLIVFADMKAPLLRARIKYQDDVAALQPFFILTTDFLTACTEEKSDVAVPVTDADRVTVVWSNPAAYNGSGVQYREFGTTPWLSPNQPGNAVGEYDPDDIEFIFSSGLAVGTTYEFLVLNVCRNSQPSPGTIVSATITAAP